MFLLLLIAWVVSLTGMAYGAWPDARYETEITFAGYGRPETLTNFSVLVLLSTNVSGFSYADCASPADGADLRFRRGDNDLELSYEMESWNTNGISYAWVQVNQLATNTSIYAMWGNRNWSEAPAYTTNGAVWDSAYEAVWHLNETVTSGASLPDAHRDFTSHRRNGDQVGNVNVDAPVAQGQYWDGTNDYIGITSSIISTANLTIATWMRSDGSDGFGAIINHDGWTTGDIHYQFPTGGTNLNYDLNGEGLHVNLDSFSFVTGVWHHVVVAYDRSAGGSGGTLAFYVDGEWKQTSGGLPTSLNPSPTPGHIGNWDATRYFRGAMDEFRILNSAPSSNWVWAVWLNMASNDQFASYGQVQDPPPTPIHYVSPNGSNVWPYANWTDAATNIQVAIDTAVSNDTVLVTNGLYNSGGAVTPGYALTNRVCIAEGITLRSVNGPEVTTIAGAPGSNGSNDLDAVRGVYLARGATLVGFTITNGYTADAGNAEVDQSGGGVWMTTNGVVYNCILSGNAAMQNGGGATLHGGGVLDNSLLAGNTAQGQGGGVYLFRGGEMNNVTVVDNTASGQGGGGYLDEGGTLHNNIFWQNTSEVSGNDLFRNGFGLEVYYVCASDGVAQGVDGCIEEDPLFEDGTNGNYQLKGFSPCVNAAGNTYAPTNWTPYDLMGHGRIAYGVVDMGAYEYRPSVLYVDASRPDDSGSGTNWATAKKSIQAAVDVVETNGTIWVTNGLYNTGGVVTPGYTLMNRVCITNAITVRSVNGAEGTTIAGAPGSNGGHDFDSVRGVFLLNGATLSGFTISNGYTMATGDGLHNQAGGGIWLGTNCVVNNCVLKDNRAHENGAGAFLQAGGTLNNCLMRNNTTFWVHGGGACLNGGGTLNNCDLVENTAGHSGGGVALASGGTLNNCIVWSNTAAVAGQDIYQYLTGMSVNYTCASDGLTNGVDGCITNNPLFLDEAASDYRLQESSPCINTGDNTTAPTNASPTDLDGGKRIVFKTVDIGAYELQFILSTNRSPSIGGGIITLTNRLLGSGTDITNVMVCGAQATILSQGVYWVQFTLGASVDPYREITGDILIQSGSEGDTTFINVFTYERMTGVVTFYVDASRPDDSGNGGTWPTAKQTIQAAVNLARDGDIVNVTNGLYSIGTMVTPGYALDNRVCITNSTTVQSVNGPEVTIIAGGPGSVRGVFMSAGTLNGFTVTNGATATSGDQYYDQSGGGLWIAANCVVSNCVLKGNFAQLDGGGAYLYYGGEIKNSVISSNNASSRGGGAGCFYGGTLTEVILCGNEAAVMGGGAFAWDNVTLNHCEIYGNTAISSGGGIMGRSATINNCLLSGNMADTGGGIYTYGATTLNNSTLYGNTASWGGGGVWVENFYGASTINNSIVWSNTAPNWNDIGGDGSALQIRNSCGTGHITNGVNGCVTSDPLFVDAAHTNVQLLSGSPCINTGDNTYAPTNASPTDLAGNPRIQFGTVDMGAYEAQWVVAPAQGPNAGGTSIILTNSTPLGSGTDITNVTVCGVQATIVTQGVNWIEVAVGASPVLYWGFTGDFALQSTSLGDAVYLNAYTYQRLPGALTFYVDASQPDDTGNGGTWATAKRTIQAAVELTVTGDTVIVTNGLYNEGATITPGNSASNRVCITKAITVRSVNGAEGTTIAGAPGSNGSNDVDSIRGVWLLNGATLNGFTISNGYTMASGDSLYDQCGAGIWLSIASVVNNCVLKNNQSTHHGAGAFLQLGGTLNNCMMRNNTAVSGHGGGACLNGGSTLNNCDLVENTAGNSGGGAAVIAAGTLNNCILWQNTAVSSGNDIFKWDVGMIIRNTCASDGVTDGVDGCTTNNPLFIQAAGVSYYVQANSPCINTGDNTYAPTNQTPDDLAGNPRIINGTVDMGAYETPTNQYLTTAVIGRGHLTGDTDGWYAPGESISLTAVPDAYCFFTNWTGDITGGTPTDNPLNLQMDQYRSITAHFITQVTTNTQTPEWWLAQHGLTNDFEAAAIDDPDSDTILTWQEYVADTDPTNRLSYFHVTSTSNDSLFTVHFDSSSNRLYTMDGCSNLVVGLWTNISGTAWRAGVGGADSMQDTNTTRYNCYRLSVELP